MYINHSTNTPYNLQNSTPKFKAIPLAKYKYGKNEFLNVYQLEKRDLPFISNFLKNLKQYFADKKIDDYSRQEVMKEAFSASEKILTSPNKIKGKARIFLAVKDSNPCGILIGNVLKESKTHKMAYSSRKNHARKETELDWLATWNPFADKKVKNSGKVLTNEFYHTLKQDGFKDVYVRSEVPELSYAVDFYKKMGFDELPNGRESIIKSSTNKYLIGNFDASDEDIIPMVASPDNIRKVKRELSDNLHREKLNHISVSIDHLKMN